MRPSSQSNERLDWIEGILEGHASAIANHDKIILALAEHSLTTTNAVANLTSSVDASAQAHTDDCLNALIGYVDKLPRN